MREIVVQEISNEERIARAKVDLDSILTRHSDARDFDGSRIRAAIALREEQAIDLLSEVYEALEDLGHKQLGQEFRGVVLTFRSAEPVPPGAIASVIVTPQKVFKGLRLIVEEGCAESFDITSVHVGVCIQHILQAGNVLPAVLFTPRYMLNDLDMDVCQISQRMTINVLNKGTKPVVFSALMFGRTTT